MRKGEAMRLHRLQSRSPYSSQGVTQPSICQGFGERSMSKSICSPPTKVMKEALRDKEVVISADLANFFMKG